MTSFNVIFCWFRFFIMLFNSTKHILNLIKIFPIIFIFIVLKWNIIPWIEVVSYVGNNLVSVFRLWFYRRKETFIGLLNKWGFKGGRTWSLLLFLSWSVNWLSHICFLVRIYFYWRRRGRNCFRKIERGDKRLLINTVKRLNFELRIITRFSLNKSSIISSLCGVLWKVNLLINLYLSENFKFWPLQIFNTTSPAHYFFNSYCQIFLLYL